MTRRPTKYDANLPRNLTYRRFYKSFYWRNPITGKEIPLGQIARRDAISQTIEANNFTGQRREDVTIMKFSDVSDGRLHVEQGKTGMLLAIPLDLTLESARLNLGEIIEQCRQESRTDFMISAKRRSSKGPAAMNSDGLTKSFVAARNKSGLKFNISPPTFHEIRSPASRLYTIEKGEEFAQRLLGHKSAQMTRKYVDTRGKEYVMI